MVKTEKVKCDSFVMYVSITFINVAIDLVFMISKIENLEEKLNEEENLDRRWVGGRIIFV